jgi:toxin ParE1/3/4
MTRFIIRPAAEEDIGELCEYIALENIAAAERIVDRLYAVMALLAEHPSMGRDRSDLGPQLRSFPAESYLIYYRETPGVIEIVRVLHGRRDADRQAF